MGIKHYIHAGGEYHTTVLGKGKSYRIHFESTSGGSVCVTGDKEVQAAIESDPRFNKKFSLCMSEQGEEIPDRDRENTGDKTGASSGEGKKGEPGKGNDTATVHPSPAGEKALQVVEEVRNISQAREYLRGQGISGNALRTPDAILGKAVEAGISFPLLVLT